MAVWTGEDSHEATQWKPEQKALIVLEGLKGRPIGELCAEHEISQAQYYQRRASSWRMPRKRSSWPARRNARAGSNARTRAQGPGRRASPGAKSEEILG